LNGGTLEMNGAVHVAQSNALGIWKSTFVEALSKVSYAGAAGITTDKFCLFSC
jgi:hypothetical protein